MAIPCVHCLGTKKKLVGGGRCLCITEPIADRKREAVAAIMDELESTERDMDRSSEPLWNQAI